MTPEERAQHAAKAMSAGDAVLQWMGIEIVEVTEGYAVLEMVVKPEHCNGHGMCHGGISYTLADTAFAYACNSRNQATVAQQNNVTYLAPGAVGDRLRAEAQEVSLQGRSGIYDVAVHRPDGTQILAFRGLSRAIRGTLFDEDGAKETQP